MIALAIGTYLAAVTVFGESDTGLMMLAAFAALAILRAGSAS